LPQEITSLLKNVPIASSGMARRPLNRIFCFFMILFSTNIIAAGNTLVPSDRNSRITVENAVIDGNETTVFFFTWPDMGDPKSGKPCPLNYYSVKLKPGLPSANADVVAKGVCGGLFQKSRLLDNGDALIIVRDRLERWRGGEQIKSQTFSSIDAVSKLGVTTDMMGGQYYDISPSGDVVLAIQSGDHTQDRSEYGSSLLVISSLKPDAQQRWEVKFSGDGYGNLTPVFAGSGGEALISNGFKQGNESQLYHIDAKGVMNEIGLTDSEPVEKVHAVPREGGGFDVLVYKDKRHGGNHSLYRIGPGGNLQSEISLGGHIVEHGLERWFDFYVDGEQLVLLSSAAVTQKVVRKVKKKWGQNIVSWIDLDTGTPTARMIPLDEQYLEAALNAGDEGQQYLDGQPGSEPALLTTMGGKPLVVSVGWISKRQVLRLHEADEQLMAYTEAYDEKQAKLAKEASSKQRNTDREARMQRMQVAEAEAAGMTQEEYNALSNREQKEAIVRNGGFDKLMETMTQESQVALEQQKAREGVPAQQGAPVQQPGMPQNMNAQIAAAMAQAQEQMANDPNMTPEMRAQMSTMMEQMGQSPGGQVTGMPGLPDEQSPVAPAQNTTGEADVPENTLKVDSGKRGFIEYENKDGRLVTLLIFNRQTGEELLKKNYPDGVIYEYVDFSRFNLPLQNVGVIYRDIDGKILEDLTPLVSK